MSDDIDWRARAKCRDHDPELWFPNQVHNRKARRDASLTARAICFECPVREQCLEWAIGVGEKWAVAGGRDFGVQSAKKASASDVRAGGGRSPDEISAP
ncbi:MULTISPECIES: WhiB family transcriptional regulator [unclassified Rhodococcus (in: high G+C Gram-positive bacteria)]|uniref:WhiB family transcriptional regulator n=1 Tax=unclassified Rhodococcus (in: high G+C Gram-positive bacteria) TaxID=192944 RepID=UPI00096AC81E|nr:MULTISPECIES: WhiB family transcriptional regulator [unclassified Rhodococcus (in: high G+C Gram-positive bacteria)]